MQNTACTNFATEKVSVTRFARKSHQRRSRNENNSVTDTKRRMRDSPTLRLGTSWPSDGEEHARGSVSFHYQKEACRTKNAHRQAKRLCSGRPRLKSGKRDKECSATSCPVRQQHEIRQKKGDKREKARRRSSEPFIYD